MGLLKPSEIKSSLRLVPHWEKKGKTISRTFEFKDFAESLRFVNEAGKIAEKLWHHPDIFVSWNKVTLTLTTHSEGGLTESDFEAAREFDKKFG
jgi:4a-hydroxytetrahydrobiopterin dehydratase